MPGRWFVVLAVLSLLWVAGCAGSERDVLSVAEWTLALPSGDAPDGPAARERPVHLPAHLDADLPRAASRYALRARVPLPPELRGRRLTFAIPYLAARSHLSVDGVALEPLGAAVPEGYRTAQPRAWRIPSPMTGGSSLALELAVDHEWPLSAWFDTVPRLSAGDAGDAMSRWVWRLTDLSVLGAAAVALFLALTYGFIFLYDRSRPAHAWFALQALLASSYPLFLLGATQPLGRMDTGIMLSMVTGANIAGVHFMHAHFGLGPPPRLWRLAWVACLVGLALGLRGPFEAVRYGAATNALVMWSAAGYQIFTYARLMRREPPAPHAATFFWAWMFLVVFASVDLTAWMGWGEPLGGLHTACAGVMCYGLLQYAALSREHAVLNSELTTRIVSLERERQENDRLADELRRQIEERSRELRLALLRANAEERAPLPENTYVSGRYRIVRMIGRGGMGNVYEAERTSDGCHVALKVLRRAPGAEAMARFAGEAEVAARVRHENVVNVLDVGTWDEGGIYIVMELVKGESLESMRHRFGEIGWVTPVLAQVARGLMAMHEAGVVHRDLKPSNILLERRGSALAVKICDFGISVMSAEADDDGPEVSSERTLRSPAGDLARLTRTGVIVGTPSYMAPELGAGSRAATAASDLFSFGLIAWELATGRLPFETPPVMSVARGEGPPPAPSLVGSALPGAVAAIVEACLRMDPTERPSARVVAEALSKAGDAPRPQGGDGRAPPVTEDLPRAPLARRGT